MDPQLGTQPDANSNYGTLRLHPPSFPSLRIQNENFLRFCNEREDDATHKTLGDIKANKRKCPKLPEGYDQVNRMLKNYLTAGDRFFTSNNPHFKEINFIRNYMVSFYRRNAGCISKQFVAHIVWAITSDACSFFSTYTEKNDIQKGENYPQSGLATIRSLVGMNSVIQVMDSSENQPYAHWTYTGHQGGLKVIHHRVAVVRVGDASKENLGPTMAPPTHNSTRTCIKSFSA